MARRYRNYSDEDKAAALAYLDACGNATMAARDCGIPRKTLEDWASGRHGTPPGGVRLEKRASLADVFEELAYRAAAQAGAVLEEASAQQAATVAGISVDKMRLLREQPTTIAEQREPASVEERDALALEILERGRLRLVNGGGS